MPFDSTGFVEIESPAVLALRRAMALLRAPHRWCKGDSWRGYWPMRRYCLLGALHDASGQNTKVYSIALDALWQASERRGYMTPVHFNDHSATTHQDVLDALSEALRIAGAKE
jgi:hypothetical protein